MQFKVGDKVVFPPHGVGIVRDIASEAFDGKSYQLYIITTLEDGSDHGVVTDHAGERGMRKVIEPESVEKVYEVLKDHSKPTNKQTWNRRYRDYLQKIVSGDPLMLAAVLRDLARLRVEKTLSFGERRMFDRAQHLVVQELAVARDVDERVIEKEIEEIFKPLPT
jgi:CarD family transcriptional regulator